MDKETLLLIILSELAILTLFIILAVIGRRLYLKRKARGPTKKATHKSKGRNKASSDLSAPDDPTQAYQQCVRQQIEQTRIYHQSLGTRTDIALDLDPMLPEPQRTVALRHALLVAECAAIDEDNNINWGFLTSRYQQILSFYQDYSENPQPPPNPKEFH